jgi:transposase
MRGAAKIQLTEQQKDEWERCIASRTVAVRCRERAKIVLSLAAGGMHPAIAEQVGVVRQTVSRWGQRFRQHGIKGLEDGPRSGRPRVIPPEKTQQIVRMTIHETPPDSLHWNSRSLAEASGVSASTVQRRWREHQLKPFRVRTFKLSHDQQFAEKTEAVVGLNWNAPPDSVVWSAEEPCQLQALSRTQPGLPCVPGHCGTRTHDYKRPGTTTLFAAKNMHGGEIVPMFCPQHRHQEWIQCLGLIEPSTAPGKQIHLIIDNYSAHKHAAAQQWLTEHPLFHVHYTPSRAPWLNPVERVFSDLTEKVLKYRSADTVEALQHAISQYLEQRNEDPKPVRWKASAIEILRKVKRAWGVLHDRYGAEKPSAALASIDRRLAAAET